MIARIWHGWTTLVNADSYHKVLTSSVIPDIQNMHLPGFRKIDVLRKNNADEIEFITIIYFDSIENIKNFTGEDYEIAHVPVEAQKFLKRWNSKASHYEVLHTFDQ